MYRTISIPNNTYQNLQLIATYAHKPKSQVIDELVNQRIETLQEKEKKQLREYNTFVAELAQRVTLPANTLIKSEDLDKQLDILQDQDM